jgi:asparagine synthase (glutamine-hydrolysing)
LLKSRKSFKYISKNLIEKFSKKDIKRIFTIKNIQHWIYNDIRGQQLAGILKSDDRGYMAFSMESRAPFLDYHYVEEAYKINPEKKVKNGFTKYLIREYLNNKLPNEVTWRENKLGWSSPTERWIARLDKNKVNNLFDSARSEKYFNIKNLKNLYKDKPQSYEVEQFMNIELFMRLFDVKVS